MVNGEVAQGACTRSLRSCGNATGGFMSTSEARNHVECLIRSSEKAYRTVLEALLVQDINSHDHDGYPMKKFPIPSEYTAPTICIRLATQVSPHIPSL